MWNKSKEPFLFNHGWEHFWFDPNNLVIKEIIKGPFLKPKLACSIPYVTLCQQDGSSVKLEEGIPDCWAEYLARNFILLRKYIRNYELMFKENVNIVPQLRKSYRLYLGQGIPDPWMSYPYFDNTEIVPIRNSKNIKNDSLSLYHFKRKNCLCCEKKYLFACPDKNSIKSCFCRDCHGRNTALTPDCGKNCKCISVLRNWVLKNTDLKQRKKPIKKGSSDSDLSTSYNSKTEEEALKGKESPGLSKCMKHYKTNSNTTINETGNDTDQKSRISHTRNNVYSKNQSRICFCSNIKNFNVKRNSGPNERNFHDSPKTMSKQIQTENPTMKDSKTVQTENSKSKLELKCQCGNKCSKCGFYQCKMSWAKAAYPNVQSLSNICLPSNIIQNPAIICPYCFANHFIIPKSSKKRNKKHKHRGSEDGFVNGPKIKQQQSKAEEENVTKNETTDPPTDPKNGGFNNNKSIYYCHPTAKGFDHMKYLTDEKLKSYLQREEWLPKTSSNSFAQQFTCSGSKFVNFCKADTSVSTIKPEISKLDKFKAFSSCKPKGSDSAKENTLANLRNSYHYIPKKLFNSSNQATMTVSEKENSKNLITKLKYYKEMTESDESRTYGLIRNRNDSNKANRRRKRLLANRKRRKKLAASGKSTIMEYQALLSRISSIPKRRTFVNQEVQVEEAGQDHQYSRRVFFSNFKPNPPEVLDICENACFRDKDVETADLNTKSLISETFKKIEDTTKNHPNFGEFSKSKSLEKALSQSSGYEMKFNKVFDKIYNNNGKIAGLLMH